MEKNYIIRRNIGRVKYAIDHHDGEKTHADGSPFYDLATFSNGAKAAEYIRGLKRRSYVERT